ncbi:MAG: hypothetical protein KDD62_15990, partial [Bdellovibrionales bacterium]|nr:hypothetical protein [Bdellovibrionales bacterium]
MIKAELHSPEPSLRAPAAERRGTLQHSEHFVDLILEQAGFPGDRQFQAFSAIAEKMIAELQQDTIPTVNEKIDGSPAVVLGFDAEGKAFVAYKKRYEHSEQVLFTNSYRVDQFYEGNLALRRTYRGCVKYLLPQLEKLREEFGDF